MPLQRIDLARGRTPAQRRAIADAIHRALVEAVNIADKSRFQVVTEHDRDAFLFAPEYLGVRHEDPIFVQITLNAGRTVEQKKRLYQRMAELLRDAGVPPHDLIVNLVEVARENWSLGDGAAQYAPAAPGP